MLFQHFVFITFVKVVCLLLYNYKYIVENQTAELIVYLK